MQPLSPISVHERYSSPTAGSAKRRLFGDDNLKEMQMEKILTEGTKLTIAPASSVVAESVSASPGHTVLTVRAAAVPGKSGQKVTIPLHGRNPSRFHSLLGVLLALKICLDQLCILNVALLLFFKEHVSLLRKKKKSLSL